MEDIFNSYSIIIHQEMDSVLSESLLRNRARSLSPCRETSIYRQKIRILDNHNPESKQSSKDQDEHFLKSQHLQSRHSEA